MLKARRRFLRLASGAGVFAATTPLGRAQSYPSRPVRIILGFPPGGTTDICARILSQWLTERLGQTFITENRPGAGTHAATEAVAHAQADGYTLLMITGTNAVNVSLYDGLKYDFVRDITPISAIIRSPFVFEVHPSLPVSTVAEFIGYAKSNPGRINVGSFGTGTGSHLSGEMFKMRTGTDMLHVPYRGSAPMLLDLVSGRVHAAFDNLPASIEHIRAGRLRALAVTTATRAETLPTVPALAEVLPGFEASAWLGLGAGRRSAQRTRVPTEDRENRPRTANYLGAPGARRPAE